MLQYGAPITVNSEPESSYIQIGTSAAANLPADTVSGSRASAPVCLARRFRRLTRVLPRIKRAHGPRRCSGVERIFRTRRRRSAPGHEPRRPQAASMFGSSLAAFAIAAWQTLPRFVGGR